MLYRDYEIQEAIDWKHAWIQLIAKLIPEWTFLNRTPAERKMPICIELLHTVFTSKDTRSRYSIAFPYLNLWLIFHTNDVLPHCELLTTRRELKSFRFKFFSRFLCFGQAMAWMNALWQSDSRRIQHCNQRSIVLFPKEWKPKIGP